MILPHNFVTLYKKNPKFYIVSIFQNIKRKVQNQM